MDTQKGKSEGEKKVKGEEIGKKDSSYFSGEEEWKERRRRERGRGREGRNKWRLNGTDIHPIERRILIIQLEYCFSASRNRR